jgi:cyclohexyl-isocyanide hydratase
MPLHIGLLTFPRVQQLDLTGPYEVFATLPDTQLHLIWKTLTPITSATGLILTPTTTITDCPQLDIICIPGGIGINALLTDETIIEFVKTQSNTARYITSVCTGALLLGAAGLLAGKRATTHWSAMEFLPAFGAIPTQSRVVRDGNIITGGGVTAGIDFALTLAAELVGQQAAETIQLTLEYAPAPPFTAGHPDTAPPETLESAQSRAAPSRAERAAIIGRITRTQT